MSVGVPVSIWKYEVLRLGVPLSHPVLDLPKQLCRDRNESVLSGLLFLLALEAEMAPRFRLNVQRAFFPVEVGVLGILHLGVTHTRIQEETIEQFFFFIHHGKHRFEFLLRVWLR